MSDHNLIQLSIDLGVAFVGLVVLAVRKCL